MTKAVSELLKHVKALPSEQQAELVAAILGSFPEDPSELTDEQKAELMRRAAFMDEHPDQLVPMDEVFRQIQDELGLKGE
jgi:putative addiction module component (TIGR02574 family)